MRKFISVLAVVVLMVDSCWGLSITFEGTIAPVPSGYLGSTLVKPWEGLYTGVEVGDRIEYTYQFRYARPWKPGDVSRCGPAGSQYEAWVESIQGRTYGDLGWAEFTLGVPTWSADEWNRISICLRDNVEVNDGTVYDNLLFEGVKFVTSSGVYNSNGELQWSRVNHVSYQGILQPSDWFDGSRLIDLPSGPLAAGSHSTVLSRTRVNLTGLTILHDDLIPGDANADGIFDQLDVVEVSLADKYQNGDYVAWSGGDWNGDGVFNQLDIVASLQTGNYLQGPYTVVPEPATWLLLAVGSFIAGFILHSLGEKQSA